MVQLLDALAYLHRRGIVHRDLTSNNVLVVQETPGPVVAIVDFWTAVDAERGAMSSVAGTPLFTWHPSCSAASPRASARIYMRSVGWPSKMLTGTYPFAIGHQRAALLQQILMERLIWSPLPVAMRPVIDRAEQAPQPPPGRCRRRWRASWPWPPGLL